MQKVLGSCKSLFLKFLKDPKGRGMKAGRLTRSPLFYRNPLHLDGPVFPLLICQNSIHHTNAGLGIITSGKIPQNSLFPQR
jgi:hypothetical protein